MKNKLFAFVIMIVMLGLIVGCSPNTIAVVNTPVPAAQAGTPDPTGKINVPGFSIEVNAPGQNPLVNTCRFGESCCRGSHWRLAWDHLPGHPGHVIYQS